MMIHRVVSSLMLLLALSACVVHGAGSQPPSSCAKRTSSYKFRIDNSMTWDPLTFKLLDNFMVMTHESTVHKQQNTLLARAQWYNSVKGVYQEIQRSVGCNLLAVDGESYTLFRAKAVTCVCMSFRQHLHQVLRSNFDCTLQSTAPEQFSSEYLQLANRINLILRMRILTIGARVLSWYDALYDWCLIEFVDIDSSHEGIQALSGRSHRGKTEASTHFVNISASPTPAPTQRSSAPEIPRTPVPSTPLQSTPTTQSSQLFMNSTLSPRHPTPNTTLPQSHRKREGSRPSSSSSGRQDSFLSAIGLNKSFLCDHSTTICIPQPGFASLPSASAGGASSSSSGSDIIELVDFSDAGSASTGNSSSSLTIEVPIEEPADETEAPVIDQPRNETKVPTKSSDMPIGSSNSSSSEDTIGLGDSTPEAGMSSMSSASAPRSANATKPEISSSFDSPSRTASQDSSSRPADAINIPETDTADAVVVSSTGHTFIVVAVLAAIAAALTGSLLYHKSRASVVSPMAQYSRLDSDEFE